MSVETLIFSRFIRHKNTGYTRPVVRIATFGVILSCIVMIFSVCISFGFKHEVSRQVFGFSGHLRIGRYQTSTAQAAEPISRNSVDWSMIEDTKKFHKQAYATQIGLIKTDLYNHGILLKGVDGDYDFSFFKSCLQEGKIPQLTDSSASNDVLISQALAKKLHLQLGDKLRTYFFDYEDIRARAFTICGIYESGFSTFDEKMILGDIRHIQKLNGWKANEVEGFEVILPQSASVKLNAWTNHAKQFNRFLPLELVATPITNDFPEIFNWLELMDMNVIVILVIMALVIAISLISVFVVMIIEKTNEIGIFKTMGMPFSSLRRIFIWKVTYIAGKGLLIGNSIGLTFCLIQKYYPLFKLDSATYYIKYVPVYLEWTWLIFCTVGTLVCVILAVCIPSIAIRKIKEADAVKFN